MNRVLTTIPAYFDGTQVRLDVKIELEPNTRLLVTILDEKVSHETLVWGAMKASEAAFARVWDNEEDAVEVMVKSVVEPGMEDDHWPGELLNEQIAQAEDKIWEQGPMVQAKIREARAAYWTGDYILEKLVKLPAAERLTIVEAALHLIRKDLQRVEPLPARTKRKQQLVAAAKALLPDYAAGGELIAFTALDSEDFYAQG
jgi:hypothetical protein